MIIPSFGLTATERVLPKLALDFTTASLDSRVTFTRSGGTSTVVSSNGYITSAGVDVPRFDYDPVTLVCKGLLIEESRTNLATYSEDFRNTADAGESRPWTYSAITLTSDAASSPSNSTTADKVVEDSSSGQHYLTRTTTAVSSGVAHTATFFVKQGERYWVRYLDSSTTGTGTFFNSSTGEFGTIGASITSNSAEQFGSGWWRVVLTYTTGASTWQPRISVCDNSGNASYQGDGTSGLYIWGAQLEAGAFATSYIPTTTAQVTRTADVATMTGTNFSDWFNASEGTFALTCSSSAIGSSYMAAAISDGTTAERVRFLYSGGSQFIVVTGGVSQASLDAGSATAGNYTTICGAYKADNFGLALDGGSVVTDTSGSLPTVDRLDIGNYNGGNLISGIYKTVKYWPQRLIDAEVQSFSK